MRAQLFACEFSSAVCFCVKTSNETLLKARAISIRWDCHPSSVIRVMRRYGVGGIKFGVNKQAARRFSLKDVERIEVLAGLNAVQSSQGIASSASQKRFPAPINTPPNHDHATERVNPGSP